MRLMRLAIWSTCLGALLIFLSTTSCVRSPLKQTPSSPSTRARVFVGSFVITWRKLFRTSATEGSPLRFRVRMPPGGTPQDWLLDLRVSCFDGANWENGGWYNARFPEASRERMYAHRVTRRSRVGYCPDWSAVELPRYATAVQAHEALFPSLFRDSLTRTRRALLDSLESIHEGIPTDSVVAGQLVRFAIDAGDLGLAARSADSCASSMYYCLRLRAVVRLAYRDSVGADSLFEAAWRNSAQAQVCDLAALRSLLNAQQAEPRDPQSCASSAEERATFWWLSNPLWHLPYNARRLEHEKRQLEISLRQQVRADELLDFSTENQASATELVTRYGWPDRLIVPDSGTEKSSKSVMNPAADLAHRPHGALHYARARSASVPTPAVLLDPIAANPMGWLRARLDPGNPFLESWPREHVRFGRFISPIEDWQVVRMMRGQQLLLALATPVPADAIARPTADSITALLYWSSGPTHTSLVATGRNDQGVLRFSGVAPNTGGVLSAEIMGYSSRDALSAWRLRTGVDSLSLVRTDPTVGARVSDIALVNPKADFAGSAPSFAQVEGEMLASTTLRSGLTNVGLYWEIYGIPSNMRVTYTLTVRSSRRGGALQLLTGLFSRRGTDDVSTTWERTQHIAAQNQSSVDGSTVRDFLRIGGLATGTYTIAVQASWGELPDQRASSALRELVVP